MLVILAGEQLLSPEQVCQTCLLADQSGQPRWHDGRLRCGQAVPYRVEVQPQQFQCPMGFRVINVD